MDEVDYSQFIYRQPSFQPPENKPRRNRPEEPNEKKTRLKRGVTVVIVTLLCFSIVFFCVDFFSKGKIIRSIYSALVKNEYTYYMVACSYPTRDMAHAGTLLAENSGGAGYFFSENGDYIVIFTFFTSKTDAQKVLDKNKNFFLYTVSYSTSDTELGNLLDSFVRDVGVALDKFDEGTFSESGVKTVLDNYIVLFSAYETEEEEKIELVSFVSSCLNRLDPGTTDRVSLLFQARHMVCSVLFSARDTFS